MTGPSRAWETSPVRSVVPATGRYGCSCMAPDECRLCNGNEADERDAGQQSRQQPWNRPEGRQIADWGTYLAQRSATHTAPGEGAHQNDPGSAA